MWNRWRDRVRALKIEVHALALAWRDPRAPWYARAVVVSVLVYALSPIDLIPDIIPVLGHLDDLILIPLGVALAVRLLPADLLAECHERARSADRAGERVLGRVGAVLVVVTWVALVVALVAFVH